tara:strand:+ start:1836 stop:2540 length:705 start_codon:yes stop_codon:yes gene_type:complete
MSKAYRGVLKARISKLYGGDVTIEKARKLKARPGATARDKQLANWFINMQTNRPLKKRKDPVVGTGKKPKGSGRRLYTDENPKDTVPIKFATVADARKTIAKVMRINKPYARKIQILTVLEQRARVMGKMEQARLAKVAKEKLKAQNKKSSPAKVKAKGGGTTKVCLPKAKIASMSSSEKQAVIRAKRSAGKAGKYKRSSKSNVTGTSSGGDLRTWVKQDWRQVGNPSKKCGEK